VSIRASSQIRSTLLLLHCIGAAGCYPIPAEFSTKELAGTYSLQHAFGLEELQVNSNGSYIQTLSGPKRTLTNSGTWVLEKQALYLHDALSFADPRGNEVAEPRSAIVAPSASKLPGTSVGLSSTPIPTAGSCMKNAAKPPNPAVNTDAHRRGFARAAVAGYLTR
jgi:hypothetical protein